MSNGYRHDLHGLNEQAPEEEEYSDSQRLDELETADDYNRFEENQLALDRDFEDDWAGGFEGEGGDWWGYDEGGEA